jgi:hypothetical protein
LFGKIAKLPPALLMFPAHDYKGRTHSTLAREFAENPRLQKKQRADFVEMMRQLNISAPTHLTEALHQYERRNHRHADARGSCRRRAVHGAG